MSETLLEEESDNLDCQWTFNTGEFVSTNTECEWGGIAISQGDDDDNNEEGELAFVPVSKGTTPEREETTPEPPDLEDEDEKEEEEKREKVNFEIFGPKGLSDETDVEDKEEKAPNLIQERKGKKEKKTKKDKDKDKEKKKKKKKAEREKVHLETDSPAALPGIGENEESSSSRSNNSSFSNSQSSFDASKIPPSSRMRGLLMSPMERARLTLSKRSLSASARSEQRASLKMSLDALTFSAPPLDLEDS